MPRRLRRQEGLGHIQMLDRIATEGGGKPRFLGQAPASFLLMRTRWGRGLQKQPWDRTSINPWAGKWECGCRSRSIYFAGETPEGASSVRSRQTPRVTASSAWVSPWGQGRADFPSRIPTHKGVRREPMTAECVHSMAISLEGSSNSTPTGDFTAQFFLHLRQHTILADRDTPPLPPQ